MNNLGVVDQNGDGHPDAILYDNENAGTGRTSVLYGKVGGGLPDTTDVDTVNLYLANGHYSLFSDITGDGIPELLLSCGNEQQVKIFIGLKGQRLKEQYGTGNDSAHPGKPVWWGKPWANVWLPNRLQSDWTRANHELFDAGDGNLDGLRDIWAVSDPFALCYASGAWLDSLADGLVYEPYAETVSDIVNLGDIDGSGVATIAVAPAVGSHEGRIIYIKPDTTIPRYGEVYRDSVPGTGPKPADVVEGVPASDATLVLEAAPNPAAGDVRLRWRGAGGASTITIVDVQGKEVARFSMPATASDLTWRTAGISCGTYLISIRSGKHAATATVVVE